ncbi:MAG: hypothetical protein ACRELB_19995 [Polyangiaceae bacterium]
MGQIAKIRRTDIEKAALFFDEAPEVQPEEVTRKEAIRILAPKIKVMRRKGYNWAKIAEALATFGISIEPDLLASYHRVASEPTSGGTKRARRESTGSPSGAQGAAPSKAASAPGVGAGAVPEPQTAGAGSAKQAEGGGPPAPRAATRTRTEPSGSEGSGR